MKIKDSWNPTKEELKDLIDAAKPFDSEFPDRAFDLISEACGQVLAPVKLNVIYEFRDAVESDLPKEVRDRLEWMIEGFEIGVEDYDF